MPVLIFFYCYNLITLLKTVASIELKRRYSSLNKFHWRALKFLFAELAGLKPPLLSKDKNGAILV